jgi:hypothetical protein
LFFTLHDSGGLATVFVYLAAFLDGMMEKIGLIPEDSKCNQKKLEKIEPQPFRGFCGKAGKPSRVLRKKISFRFRS